jgi:hypothetical protein
LALACGLFGGTLALPANAATVSTSGTLPDAPLGAYHLFNFEVTTAGIVSLELDGNTDSWLGLFSGTNVLSNATFLGQDDDGGPGLDSFMSVALAVGSYTAWITTHGSYWDTSTNSIYTYHDHTPMSYTLSITGDVSNMSPVPLPASLPLLMFGLAGLGVAARRRKTR